MWIFWEWEPLRTLYIDANICQHFLASKKSWMISDDAANRAPLENCQNRNHSCPSCQQHLVIFRSHFPALWCPKKNNWSCKSVYSITINALLLLRDDPSIDGTKEIINMIMVSLTAFVFNTATFDFPLFPVAHVHTLALSLCILAIDLSLGNTIYNFWH